MKEEQEVKTSKKKDPKKKKVEIHELSPVAAP